MSMPEIIKGPRPVEYPHGIEKIEYECDICKKSNYPIYTWPTDDDPYINAYVCSKCIASYLSGII
jgi:uncharacterized protein CbrC (UPF0167 family)